MNEITPKHSTHLAAMKTLALLAAAALAAPAANAQLFAPGVTLTTGNVPFFIAQGDLNGDGALDLAVCNWSSNDVSVFLGAGDGTFSTQQTFPVGAFPTFITLADLDNDGDLDVVVTNRGQAPTIGNTLSVLLGNGDGTFAPQQVFTTGAGPNGVSIGDMNGDGNLDLAVAAVNDNGVSILLGNGDGTFLSFQTFPTNDLPLSVAMGDVNGDGNLDLALAHPTTGTNAVSTLLGNGDGTFAPFHTLAFPLGAGPYSLGIADFDTDGNLDIVTADFVGNTVSILRGNGDGTFASPNAFPSGGAPNIGAPMSITIGDINNDGSLDVAVANVFDDYVSILLGNGNATFAPTQSFMLPFGSGPVSIALGDYDADGDLDMAVVDQGANHVSIMLNQTDTPATNPADFNHDGTVDGADLAFLLTNWGPVN